MMSRLLALVLAAFAALFAIAFGALALEEIASETEEVRACVHNVTQETRSRGNDVFPFPPSYLVIETDRNPQRFVHYLGATRQDDAVAERVRPGDCVRITVDQAALEGPPLEETAGLDPSLEDWLKDRGLNAFLAKRALKTLALGWPLLPDYDRPWVRIQSLAKGDEELISPREALFWPLLILGGISLLCFAVTARQLRQVVFGAPAR